MQIEISMLLGAKSTAEAENIGLKIAKQAYNDFIAEALDKVFDELAIASVYCLVHDAPDDCIADDYDVEPEFLETLQNVTATPILGNKYYEVCVNLPVAIANISDDDGDDASIYTLWIKVHKKAIPCYVESPLKDLNYNALSAAIEAQLDRLKILLNFRWDILQVSSHHYKPGYPYFYDSFNYQSIGNTEMYELV